MEEERIQQEVQPVHFKWIIIKNKRYEKLRTKPGFDGFADLPAVDDDAVNVKKGVKGLGARVKDINVYEDTDFDELYELFKDITREVETNWERGRETTFIFVYYAGHGVLDATTWAVMNTDTKKWRFPLENLIRTLGANRGAWVVGLFDCCRKSLAAAMRDDGAIDVKSPDEEPPYRGTLLSFGCPPNSGVDARSTIAVEYFV